ncbi:MAG: flagellar FliJ family protein [Actinobacteria bacterium]|jgi:flagellar export protein FliJ|nr:flagellar FliJ family protein [Actinomycetota bacterium]
MSRIGQLDLLLRLRELGERKARTRLGEASAEQAQADRRVRDLEEAIDALPVHEHLTTREFRSVMAAQHAMAALVITARQEALARAAATAAARDAWISADRDREGMDSLVDRARQLDDDHRAALEQRETDDLVTSRHGRHQISPEDGTP